MRAVAHRFLGRVIRRTLLGHQPQVSESAAA